MLPAIQKDIRKRRSTDLEYTLDSDKFSFEINQSMELDLFEDIRASIHRSITVPRVLKSGCKSRVGGEAYKQKTQCKCVAILELNFVANGRGNFCLLMLIIFYLKYWHLAIFILSSTGAQGTGETMKSN